MAKETTKLKKTFGIGPLGALISTLLFALALWIDARLGYLQIFRNAWAARTAGAALVLAGLGMHVWTMKSLQNWWRDDQLCTRGPFKFFRHPMYAAWVSVIFPGIALAFNSWALIFWVAISHPVWHTLVPYEEKMMRSRFGDAYDVYARKTGRFLPRLRLFRAP